MVQTPIAPRAPVMRKWRAAPLCRLDSAVTYAIPNSTITLFPACRMRASPGRNAPPHRTRRVRRGGLDRVLVPLGHRLRVLLAVPAARGARRRRAGGGTVRPL